MKDRSDDPSPHERTLSPQSYISLRLEQEIAQWVHHEGLVRQPSTPRAAHLAEVVGAEPGLVAELPLALDVSVVQLARQLVGELQFGHMLRLVVQAVRLRGAGENNDNTL